MKMKKHLAMVLAISLSATAFVGCSKGDGGNSSSSNAKQTFDFGGKTVKIYGLANPEGEKDETKKAALLKRKEEVEKKYNAKIQFAELKVEDKEIANEIAKTVAAGAPLADIIKLNGRFMPSLIAQGAVVEVDDAVKKLKIPQEYVQADQFKGKTWGFSWRPSSAEGLFFNSAMINKAGMEKLPNQMFKEGKWSYTDFYNYLNELKGKLSTNEYPFFIDPYYFMLFGTHANGSYVINNEGKMGYLNDGTLESLEFIKKVKDNGLMRPANTDKDGKAAYWSTPQETFDKGIEVAMSHRALWQVSSIVGKFDYGYVPYPWGSQVKVNGDYKTISDKYKSAYYDFESMAILKGTDKTGTPEALLSLGLDYESGHKEGEKTRLELMAEEYDKYTAKGQPVPRDEWDVSSFMNDDLSMELFTWANNRSSFEAYPSFGRMTKLTFGSSIYKVIDEKQPVRATLESAYNVDKPAMESAGFSQK